MDQPFDVLTAIVCGVAVLDGMAIGMIIYVLLRNNELTLPSAVFSVLGGLLAMIVVMHLDRIVVLVTQIVIVVLVVALRPLVTSFRWFNRLIGQAARRITNNRTWTNELLQSSANVSSQTQQPSRPSLGLTPEPPPSQSLQEPRQPSAPASSSSKSSRTIPLTPFEPGTNQPKGFRGRTNDTRDHRNS